MDITYTHYSDSSYDHRAVQAIGRAIRPDELLSAESLIDWEQMQVKAGRYFGRWLATADGGVVGSGTYGQSPWLEPDLLYTHVMVHPDHQGRGIGRELFARVETSASEAGATRLTGTVHEDDPKALDIVLRNGWVELDREWESRLDLTEFDPEVWEPALASLERQGVSITSIQELRRGEGGWENRLHQLYVTLEQDVPTPHDIKPVPYDDFLSFSLGRNLLPDGYLVALDGDEMVGLTEPQRVDGKPTVVAQELTGVLASHRGRGIATALKVAAAIWAKEQGFESVRTWNAQSNVGMLAANAKLGFKRGPAIIEVMKHI